MLGGGRLQVRHKQQMSQMLTLPNQFMGLQLQQEKQLPNAQISFVCDDFFKFDVPTGKFSLIFDYT